jgi:multiple sugar transport system substrate-binding protein
MTRPDKGIRANQVVVLIIWVATSCFNITARSLSMMLVTVFLLTACQTTIGRPSPEPHLERDENHDDVITITFACNGCRPDLGQGVLFGELVDRFEAENPDVNIELVALSDVVDAGWPGENPEILTHQLLSAVDTAGWPPTLPATDANLIMNLTPFINADASFNQDDFYPPMLEHLQWRNGTWALPMLGDLYVILYNRDLFDTSGVPYPQDNWTWTDFLNLTQRLTVQEGAIVEQYGFINPGPGRGHEVFIAGLSGGRSHALDTPRGAYLLDPVVVDALRQYTDLAQYHGVRLSEKEALESQWLFDLIVDGKVAMWLGRVSDLGLMKFSKLRDTSIGLAPLPLGDETAAYVFSDAYVMSSGTRHPEESWRWLRFLTSQTIQGPRYVDMIPVRRSVAEETGYWSRWDEKTLSAITYVLEHAQVIKGWMRSDVYDGIVGEILHGKPVEDALMDAQVAVAQAEAIRAVATPLSPPMVAEYSPEVKEGTEITFAPLGLNPTVYQRQAENFNAAQSDVYVEVVSPSERETADCFVSLGYSEEPAQLNLDPIIQRDVSFSAMDIEPVFFGAFQHQGNPFGLPIGADYVQVIVYNRDLFDAAGVVYPQPGWAWDDFIRTATALTEHNDGITRYGYMALAGHRADVHAFLALHGAALWGEQGLPRFDAPDVVAAVRYYRDLAWWMA